MPMWWFVFVFIDLLIFLLYLIVAICSIIFLMNKRHKFGHRFIPILINILPILIIVISPPIYRNKNYPVRTVEIPGYRTNKSSQHLYLESYCVHGSGALGGDLYSSYLTDSINFRKYVGTYDDGEEMITAKCLGDNVVVMKTTQTGFYSKKTSSQTFNLKQLTDQYAFD